MLRQKAHQGQNAAARIVRRKCMRFPALRPAVHRHSVNCPQVRTHEGVPSCEQVPVVAPPHHQMVDHGAQDLFAGFLRGLDAEDRVDLTIFAQRIERLEIEIVIEKGTDAPLELRRSQHP